MSRHPDNNPTERIGRLLEELAELVGIVQAHMPHMLPRLPAFESEKTRRSLTYTRNVNRVRTRHAMNNSMSQPYRAAKATEKFYHEDAQRLADEMTQSNEEPNIQPLSLEDIEIQINESKRKEINEVIEQGKFKSVDTYQPPKSSELFSRVKPKVEEE